MIKVHKAISKVHPKYPYFGSTTTDDGELIVMFIVEKSVGIVIQHPEMHVRPGSSHTINEDLYSAINDLVIESSIS